MPRRGDLSTVMVLGSGPIVIGQAAEFDYSGSQACQSLKEEGLRVVLVNSNPATIQTDPGMAARVYIEPLSPDFVARIIERERPQGLLAGMGGQTALNLAIELAESGVLEHYGVELLGTSLEAIALAESREKFATLMRSLEEPIPRSRACGSVEESLEAAEAVGGYPVIVRPAFTLGGSGSGIARGVEELRRISALGLAYSRVREVLVEEAVISWGEFEYEVVRDGADNGIIVCNMENLDPMGIHTGESMVVAPAQTLSDREHQLLRNASLRIIRALGIRGGCNIQFAVHPVTREYRVIEVNPRVSRSSALASKATGYPIARVAAKIAIGLNLDEIPNAVTGRTKASFEPSLDYVVMKIPRWPFDKFPTADRRIGTSMKSTGEAMAIARSFEEALVKAMDSLELSPKAMDFAEASDGEILEELSTPTDRRLGAVLEALRRSWAVEKLADLTGWHPYFLRRAQNVAQEPPEPTPHRGFRMVDTCAAEFVAHTPYFYSSRGESTEHRPLPGPKVLVVGSGPIRIGQGQEFDTVCTEGVMALREEGYGALMINCNPETVSTDFDISDRLFFEPLTLEGVLRVIEVEQPDGIILQFGGQTSVNLALPLAEELRRRHLKTKILGTAPLAMDIAEDRRKFSELLERLHLRQAPYATGFSFGEVREAAKAIEYPVLVRPSYVLGGRGMEVVSSEEELEGYMARAVEAAGRHPVLVDKFLTHATEVDVDAVCDGREVFIGGIQEHIEEAGVHSGDAAAVMPPQTLSPTVLEEIRSITRRLSLALDVVGLLNLQLAVKADKVYVLEANPRASRTVPFVSKATGVSLTKTATKAMLGKSLADQALRGEAVVKGVAVKVPVFPFQRLPGVDCILGPEMKSTGEVMGLDVSLGRAYYKAMLAAGNPLPRRGGVYLTVKDEDKPAAARVAQGFAHHGLALYATRGTAAYLREAGVPVTTVYRIGEGRSPDALGLMRAGDVNLVVNTPTEGSGPRRDGYMMRRLAVDLGIPFITTMQGALAAAAALEEVSTSEPTIIALQDRTPGASVGTAAQL